MPLTDYNEAREQALNQLNKYYQNPISFLTEEDKTKEDLEAIEHFKKQGIL